ncbi:MAG: hypothetical protein ACFFBC_00170 [Promethearchaeota archaeon]
MDEKIKNLLKSMIELGNKLRNESLKKKERLKLEREWKIYHQEIEKYLGTLIDKIINSQPKIGEEEEKKLEKEWKTVFKISWDSNPNIDHSWNPLKIQRIIESVREKALEKRLDKNDLKKESSIPKKKRKRIWFLDFRWTILIKELARENFDPKVVRPVLLALKDYDEGKIDMEKVRELFQEASHPPFDKKKFLDKYPILKPRYPSNN